MRSRRFLPSISLLAAFEAVLRTGSTTAAAEELQLSQSTVSRLVQTLEAQLGRPLFTRQRRRLIPTKAALSYGRDLTRALDLIQRSSMELVANPDGGTLSIAILPAFGTRWLAPRLGGFLARNPGVTINLATRLRPFSFAQESFDAAVFFGDGGWPGTGQLKLLSERLTACAAPALLERQPVRHPSDLAGHNLMRLETRPAAWSAWFARQGVSVQVSTGMLFDQFAPMIQAAITGLGIALLPTYIADTEIAERRLVPILQPDVEGSGAYWLTWPEERSEYPPLEAFRSWIATECGI